MAYSNLNPKTTHAKTPLSRHNPSPTAKPNPNPKLTLIPY